MERLHDRGLPQSRWTMDRLGAHAITIAAYGIESALGTHFTLPSAAGRGMAPRRFRDFSAGIVERRQVLEYDNLPQWDAWPSSGQTFD
jgi:hypothetical protein